MVQIQHATNLPSTDDPFADSRGPCGSLRHRCANCLEPKAKLSRCSGCQVVRYCSREHQVQHRQDHKSTCNKIKRCRAKVDKEEHAIRNARPDFMTPANAFETSVGHFWGLLSTRDYTRARFALVTAVRRTGTLDGVTESLLHSRDMMRLCRSDNLGLRDLIPAVMLQLDQDQECYDFIKWYETEGQRDDYDWGNMDLPFLNVKDADVLEDVEYMCRRYGSTQHTSAIMLLKLKLLIDIINIRLTRKVLATRLPRELWEYVELGVIRSPISRQWVGDSDKDLTRVQKTLEIHIKLLARAIGKLNQYFTSSLIDADEGLAGPPGYYSQGTVEEMDLLLYHSYAAWRQHEGALELLRSAKAIAGKDSEDEIEGMMSGMTFKTNPGSDRTKEELLDDVSRNRLWGYFDVAVEDAISLNEIRPSQVKREEIKARWEAEEREYYAENMDHDSESDSD